MVPASNLWAFVLASIVLIVIPGPSVLFVIGRSLALGRMGGLLSVLGNAIGMLPLVAAVALGVGTVVAQSVALFTAIKLGGALYLVYLGVQAIRHRADAADAVTRQVAERSPWRLLGEGVVVGVTNPKTIAFFVAVLPQFVDFHAGAIPMQMAMLGTAFVVLALACDSAWALAAGTARDWFARSPRRASHLAATGGVMMIGLGGVLALSGNEH
ncbi:LysE family translocator [Agromyces kandeliae]|uniref:LysE family translocator n=1 Tax=Agromyces kandeliae TaxID=2666141 RepID=A0A6L5R1W7_9MICO|nr:LysE family translocator [Agromyces kandeliae]MRX43960.1 LysE family translocator [Agromyces kandeliae]